MRKKTKNRHGGFGLHVLLKSDIHLLVDSYQVSNYKEGGTTTVGDDEE